MSEAYTKTDVTQTPGALAMVEPEDDENENENEDEDEAEEELTLHAYFDHDLFEMLEHFRL